MNSKKLHSDPRTAKDGLQQICVSIDELKHIFEERVSPVKVLLQNSAQVLKTCYSMNRTYMATNKPFHSGQRWRFMFRALTHRNFRLFFTGQAISLLGTWIQMTAITWLVWRLEHNAFLLGLTGFAARIPAFILAPLAGVWVDRWSRHRLVILTQALAMIEALVLAALMFSGCIAIWQIILLSLFLGMVNALDMPARQSFLIQMLDRPEDLTSAIALNSSMVNGARLAGPVLAGVIIATFNEGVCFLVNGLSYIAVIAGLLMMKLPVHRTAISDKNIFQHLKEGFAYAFGFPPIRALLLLVAAVSLAGASYSQLLPVFAEKILHGGPLTQGLLASSAGLGAFIGAIYLALRRSVRGLDLIIAHSPVVFGLGLIGMGLSSSLRLTLAVMPVIGFGMIIQMAATNTVLQTIVEDDKRGRVMSFYSMAFMGTVPLGSLLAGVLVPLIGAPVTVILSGIFCLIAAAFFITKLKPLRQMIHLIYVRKGIVPEAAGGLQPVSGIPPLQLRSRPWKPHRPNLRFSSVKLVKISVGRPCGLV
ncbi:MAG: MFS transporter [Pontiellaceae bacterium]|jgi:MFS family permease|nr:MFS transporter [Pontiellaceae bacterium]